MALILCIESSSKNCSIALADKGKVLESVDFNDGNFSHAEKLHVFIEEVCKKADKTMKDLDAIAVSKGPGSYTGLRIGVSTAKGLAYGLNIPILSVESLEVLTRTFCLENTIAKNALLIPMMDARRMEVYTCQFDLEIEKVSETRALILEADSFEEELKNNTCYFFGDGALKSEALYKAEKSHFSPELYPSAKAMAQCSYKSYLNEQFEDVAYFEPYYLKDFVDGMKPKA